MLFSLREACGAPLSTTLMGEGVEFHEPYTPFFSPSSSSDGLRLCVGGPQKEEGKREGP